jgi:hypothetical protein
MAMEPNVRERASDSYGLDEDRAVAEALHWAEAVADRGDFSYAVKWLDRAEELIGGLSPKYQRRRRTWEQATDAAS